LERTFFLIDNLLDQSRQSMSLTIYAEFGIVYAHHTWKRLPAKKIFCVAIPLQPKILTKLFAQEATRFQEKIFLLQRTDRASVGFAENIMIVNGEAKTELDVRN